MIQQHQHRPAPDFFFAIIFTSPPSSGPGELYIINLIIPGKESNFISPFGSRFKRSGQSHEAGIELGRERQIHTQKSDTRGSGSGKKIILNYLNLSKAHTKIVSREQAKE
jgi:hypothetical protein